MSKPVAYRFKSPLSEEGQWEYGKEPPVGSRWEIEGLYRMQVNVPRTPLEKAAKEMLRCVDRMLRDGEWYAAQEKADALRVALEQAEPVAMQAEPVMVDAKAVRESQQRERLDSHLAGRKKGLSGETEFAVPHLAEQTEPSFVISPERMTWDDAVAWAEGLGMRLATVKEMHGMGLPPDFYWSGTEYSQSNAWHFNSNFGFQNYDYKSNALFSVAVPSEGDSGNPSF